MTHISPDRLTTGADGDRLTQGGRSGPGRRRMIVAAIGLAAVVLAGAVILRGGHGAAPQATGRPLAHVTVSRPLRDTAASTADFLGQFAAVDSVDLRAQVGGTLVAIGFRDGQIVHKGDLLFSIDPRPYAVKVAEADASLRADQAKQALTAAEAWRARQLKLTDFGSAETVDQRAADDRAATAAIAGAQAALDDARLDLGYTQVTAPFGGRIGAHQVSVGNLISGSRGGTSGTTLLATIVSLDPIHLDFDMSESDYDTWRASHPDPEAPGTVAISLADDGRYTATGTLDFVDNQVDRASGTIRARATVPNPNLTLTPGQFARVRLVVRPKRPVLLVPAAAIVPDQSRELVMTVAADGTVVPKPVSLGGLHNGLRIVREGLAPDDRVIIDGLMLAQPGSKVVAADGKIVPAAAGSPRP